ncbi:unnamed protein product [Tuber aestivum]|uniref:Uncharacterized protein n=1 Tax=Tuber aestivum TaxID=59557 RepID=A0A292Q7N0_9PEZI|nr:unnamed protein product [Tuber aestivum]
MDNLDATLGHHSSPQDSHTPVLYPTPHAIPTSLELRAEGSTNRSPQALPLVHFLQNVDPEWRDLQENREEELETMLYGRVQELEEKWFRRYSDRVKESEEKSMQIFDLQGLVRDANARYLKLSGYLNLRGALGAERIVEHAKELKKLPGKCPSGTQAALDILATTQAFKKILEMEIKGRKLVGRDVKRCIPLVYHECSKHAHGNTGMITVDHGDRTRSECAVLVAFLKLQDGWTGGLKWKEADGDTEPGH